MALGISTALPTQETHLAISEAQEQGKGGHNMHVVTAHSARVRGAQAQQHVLLVQKLRLQQSSSRSGLRCVTRLGAGLPVCCRHHMRPMQDR